MTDWRPTITETMVHGGLVMKLADGRELYRIYRKREYDAGTRLIEVRDNPDLKFSVREGWVDLGPGEEWCKDPDGTERRCSHFAELMQSWDDKKSPDSPRKQSWINRVLGIVEE
jgi:hypothetical protein